MPFVPDFLPNLDEIRAIPGAVLGLRPYRVFLVHTTTAGGKAWDGAGVPTNEEATELLHGTQPVKVRVLTTKDYLAGYPQDCELGIILTPELTATIAQIDRTSEHTFYRVFGHGFGENGTNFRRTYLNTQSALTWKIGLKRTSTSDRGSVE